jgi:uncharacterized protein YqhQ
VNIGGMSSGRGITFSAGFNRARAVRDGQGNLRVQVHQSGRSGGKLERIPFIRGIATFMGFRPLLLLLLASLLLDLSPLLAGPDVYTWENGIGWIALVLIVVLMVVRFFFLRDVLKYHAAEHMALNAYESGKELTVENILASPRTHPRCGTILAIYVILVAVPCSLLIPYISVVLLLSASVSYELFLYAPKYQWLRWLPAAGLWLQKVVTTAPPDLRPDQFKMIH